MLPLNDAALQHPHVVAKQPRLLLPSCSLSHDPARHLALPCGSPCLHHHSYRQVNSYFSLYGRSLEAQVPSLVGSTNGRGYLAAAEGLADAPTAGPRSSCKVQRTLGAEQHVNELYLEPGGYGTRVAQHLDNASG